MTERHLFLIVGAMCALVLVWLGYTVGERHGRETAWIELEVDEQRAREREARYAAWRAENPPIAEPDYDQCVDLLNSWHARPPGGPDRF